MAIKKKIEFFQWLYDYFNKQLFKKKLPGARIEFNKEAKKSGILLRIQNEEMKPYLLSFNIEKFYKKSPVYLVSMMINQMVHIWLIETKQNSRPGYCNRKWAQKMEEIGLMPSQNEKEGGKRTGQFVLHYIMAGGAFELAYNLMDDKAINYLAKVVEKIKLPSIPAQNQNKTSYQCPGCAIKAWGKPGLSIICGKCEKKLQ